jgi:hypothetical protein
MAIVTPVISPRTADPGELDRFFKTVVGRFSYQTYDGDPTTHVTPRWIGDRCLDTTNSKWYFSHGTAAADWKAAT